MTTDWRLYELLTYDKNKPIPRPGDEPHFNQSITVKYGDKLVVVPLPDGAVVIDAPD